MRNALVRVTSVLLHHVISPSIVTSVVLQTKMLGHDCNSVTSAILFAQFLHDPFCNSVTSALSILVFFGSHL